MKTSTAKKKRKQETPKSDQAFQIFIRRPNRVSISDEMLLAIIEIARKEHRKPIEAQAFLLEAGIVAYHTRGVQLHQLRDSLTKGGARAEKLN